MMKMTFWNLRSWKQLLMDKLNANVFDATEWGAFIDAAEENGCTAMAADMKNKLDHYKQKLEAK